MKMKKTVLLAIVAMISMGSALGAGCSACAANAAFKQSVKDAQAAALAAKPKEAKLAQAKQNAKADKRAKELDAIPAERAPREPQVDPCTPCGSDVDAFQGDLNCKLQALFNCCVHANQQLQHQGREAKKCCKKLRHEIDEVEDLVISSSSVIDSDLSVIETLMISQIDQTAACCSTTEAAILDLNISVAAVLALVLSIFDCTCT